MDERRNMSLEQKTQEYWKIQYAAHERGGKPPTTQDVLRHCRELVSVLNPARPLATRIRTLESEVIIGGRRKKGLPAAIVTMKKVAVK